MNDDPRVRETPYFIRQQGTEQARICYVIAEEGTGYRKIGITKDSVSLTRRLQNLQQGNPRKLSLEYRWEFQKPYEAFNLETSLLVNFNGSRTETEWVQAELATIIGYATEVLNGF